MTRHKRSGRKKEGRIPKDPVSTDLRSRESWLSFVTPSDNSGEYIGKLLEEIRPRVGRAYHAAKRPGIKPDYLSVVNQVLDQMGFAPKAWERGAIYSVLSRETHKRRRAKIDAAKARLLEEAGQADLFHPDQFKGV